MTEIIEDDYNLADWDGTDFSAGKVRAPGESGGIQVGWNLPNGVLGEVIFTVADAFGDSRSTVVLDKDSGLGLLNHLNTLLGNPLSHPATAGDFAPSAD